MKTRQLSKKEAEVQRAALAAKYARTESWNGFEPGDKVKIKGTYGGHWRYRCHVRNVATGATWVEVAELELPKKGAHVPDAIDDEDRQPRVRCVRSFAEDRLVRVGRRRRATASAVERTPTFCGRCS